MGFVNDLQDRLGSTPANVVLTPTLGAVGNPAKLDAFGRLPNGTSPNGIQTGVYFNSYTENDPVNTDMTTTSLATIESDLSFTADFALLFGGLTPNAAYSQNQWNRVKAFLDAGRKVVLNIAATGTLANINAGQFDAGFAQLGAFVAQYARQNPNWKDRLIVKYLHEGNVSIVYPWTAFTATNISDAGSEAAAIAAGITAFQRLTNVLRTAATTGGTCYVQTVWEIGSQNDTGTLEHGFYPFETFYPGDAYVDIVSATIYNRAYISSGLFVWRSLEIQATPVFDAFRRFAPGKPIMIGECSTTDGGQVAAISVTAGGSGYSGTPTVTLTGAGSGFSGTATVSGGAITGVTINNRGRNYTDQTGYTIGGGGTGATLSISYYSEKQEKGNWFYDAQLWLRDQTDVAYVSWFFTNITSGTVAGATYDYRYWAPNTTREKTRWSEGYQQLRKGRVKDKSPALMAHGRIGTNLCPDPYANDISKWTAAGTNVGTLARTAANQNTANYDSAFGDLWGAIRLTHNGTAGNAQDNRILSALLQGSITSNTNYVLTFDARFKPTAAVTGVGYLAAGIETGDSNVALRPLSPVIQLGPQWRRYKVHAYATSSTGGWKLCFAIGRSTQAGHFSVSNIKLEYGDEPTVMLPAHRQVTRTVISDVAYTMVNGSTDEVFVFKTLTAARTFTLCDATTVPVGKALWVKDESGTAGTNNITVNTTASQTIDGGSTGLINSNYGRLQVYTDGANWFRL